MPKHNTMPVVMYPEGIIVGKVTSGRGRPGAPVRHIATDQYGYRVGTFDTFAEAKDALVATARAGTDPA